MTALAAHDLLAALDRHSRIAVAAHVMHRLDGLLKGRTRAGAGRRGLRRGLVSLRHGAGVESVVFGGTLERCESTGSCLDG